MEQGGSKQNDHDILIELKTEFKGFREEQSNNWARFHEKLARLFTLLDEKAEKADMKEVANNLNAVILRVQALEGAHTAQEGQIKGYKGAGNGLLKAWSVLSGLIILGIAVLEFIIK